MTKYRARARAARPISPESCSGRICGWDEPRRDADLAEEPLGLVARHRAEHLDGHLAAVLQVLGQVDGGRTSAPDLVLEPVALGDDAVAGEGEVRGGHREKGKRPTVIPSAARIPRCARDDRRVGMTGASVPVPRRTARSPQNTRPNPRRTNPRGLPGAPRSAWAARRPRTSAARARWESRRRPSAWRNSLGSESFPMRSMDGYRLAAIQRTGA